MGTENARDENTEETTVTVPSPLIVRKAHEANLMWTPVISDRVYTTNTVKS